MISITQLITRKQQNDFRDFKYDFIMYSTRQQKEIMPHSLRNVLMNCRENLNDFIQTMIIEFDKKNKNEYAWCYDIPIVYHELVLSAKKIDKINTTFQKLKYEIDQLQQKINLLDIQTAYYT
jgi:hypothetical protein